VPLNDQTIAYPSNNNDVVIFSLQCGALVHSFKIDALPHQTTLFKLPTGHMLCSFGASLLPQVWDVGSGKSIDAGALGSSSLDGLSILAVLTNGTVVARTNPPDALHNGSAGIAAGARSWAEMKGKPYKRFKGKPYTRSNHHYNRRCTASSILPFTCDRTWMHLAVSVKPIACSCPSSTL